MAIKYCIADWAEDDTVYWSGGTRNKVLFSRLLSDAVLLDDVPRNCPMGLVVLPVFVPNYQIIVEDSDEEV